MLPAQKPAVGQAQPRPAAVQITGVVTDATGRVLPDLQVVLEAAHRTFEIRKLAQVHRGRTQRTTRTDADGRYLLRWHRNEYFNHFELLIGMTVRVPDGDRFYTLERLPLEGLLGEEEQLTLDVTVADTRFLARYRNFVAGLDSEDQREVYAQMGIPAKIDTLSLATHQETTWWYFEAGKVYRFEEGVLAEISDFDPVTPFENDSERQR